MLVEPHQLTPTTLPRRAMECGGWLAVEATGLSGSDVQAWQGKRRDMTYPTILGEQVVGRIATAFEGLDAPPVGTRVLVEPIIHCQQCKACRSGLASCSARRPANSYGHIPTTEPPGLWGGLAESLYIDPGARLHVVADDVSAEMATFAHPLAAGYSWAVEIPRLAPGENVLVLGPGPRGLACLLAAQAAGAGWIGITGLDTDQDRLGMARQLGANATVDITREEVGEAVAGSLGTRPDVVIDVTSDDPEAIYTALDLVRPGGRVVLGSTKAQKPLEQFFSDIIIHKQLNLHGAKGASTAAYQWATAQLEADSRIDEMVSHQFPLNEAPRALQAAAGLLGMDELISVAVTF